MRLLHLSLRLPRCLPLAVLAGCLLSAFVRAEIERPAGVTSTAFASPSAPQGTTLFQSLAAGETGITAINRYDDPKMWNERYLEFTLGAFGTGVAIGDFDKDGRPDVCVTTKTGPTHLYRNLGDFKFEDVAIAAGVAGDTQAWYQGAAFVDINNDGWLDLYICRFGAPNFCFINQRNGTFTEEAEKRGLAIVDASGQACFADYDRDGHLDVYLQTNLLDIESHPTGQRDYLLHNRGDGTFEDVTERARISGETQGHSATWWDYDEDGWPDLYVANDFKDPDKLYHNTGEGVFVNDLSRALPHTPHSSMGVDLNDVNNDGRIDLLVADMATPDRVKDQRGMAKLRTNHPDSDSVPGIAQQYMRNALYLNTGTGRVQEAAMLAGLDATDWTWSVRLEDLDNDGRVDAFFTNGMVRELHNADLVNRMGTLESRAERILLMKNAPVLAEANLAFRNRGDLIFENVSKNWGLDRMGVSLSAAFGDLDGDGDLDLVMANMDEGFSVYRNSSNGHAISFALEGTRSNRFGLGAIIRLETDDGLQARALISARGYMSTDEPVAHFGLGNLTHVKRATIEWPSGIVQQLSDLEAGRRYTLEEPDRPGKLGPTGVVIQGQFSDVTEGLRLGVTIKDKGFNELAKQPLLAVRQNRVGPAAAVVDLDGDGHEDIVVGGATGEGTKTLSNLGGSNYMALSLTGVPALADLPDGPLLFVDVNGDGAPDLLATKAGNARAAGDPLYAPRLFWNDGRGTLTPAVPGAVGAGPLSVGAACAADFDRDGRLDIFLGARNTPFAYPKTPDSVLLANRNDRLEDVTDAFAPGLRRIGMVTSALWTDADQDGWPDLLVAVEWGNVHLFHNDGGRRLVDVSASTGLNSVGKGWWSSLAAADFNGDGKPDFAVGNLGLNTPYRASAAEPATLLSGVFDPNGRTQIVEVNHFGGRRYPMRGIPQLGTALPAVGKRFPNFESYAKATLEEVIPADRLAAAEVFTAGEFQSGLWLSQKDGAYLFSPLPRVAQLAPIHGMLAGDFDGDGKADLLFVGNSSAPISELGRFDGGVGYLLSGDGRGGLSAVPPATSGIVVSGHAEALLTLDYDGDGWPDLFTTRHGERTQALRNHGLPGRHSFQVRLTGTAGNPTAIGASVTVRYGDGTTLSGEISAGGTRLAQSSAALFFGYTDHNLPHTLQVRWPDGRTSEFPWPGPNPLLVLPHP